MENTCIISSWEGQMAQERVKELSEEARAALLSAKNGDVACSGWTAVELRMPPRQPLMGRDGLLTGFGKEVLQELIRSVS